MIKIGKLIIDNKSFSLLNKENHKLSQESNKLYKDAEYISENTKENVFIGVDLSSTDEHDYSCIAISKIKNEKVIVLQTLTEIDYN